MEAFGCCLKRRLGGSFDNIDQDSNLEVTVFRIFWSIYNVVIGWEAKHLGSRVVALTVLGAAPAAAGTAGGQHGRQWW